MVAGWHDLCTFQGFCALAAGFMACLVQASSPNQPAPLTVPRQVSPVSLNAATSTSTLGKKPSRPSSPQPSRSVGSANSARQPKSKLGLFLSVAIAASSRTAERAGWLSRRPFFPSHVLTIPAEQTTHRHLFPSLPPHRARSRLESPATISQTGNWLKRDRHASGVRQSRTVRGWKGLMREGASGLCPRS